MRPVVRLAVVVPIAAALALGACARPGTVATVDGRRITDTELAATVSDFQELGQPILPGQVLPSIITSGPLLEAASEMGVGVSRDQGVAVLDELAAQNGRQPFDYSEPMIELARVQWLGRLVDPTQAEAIVSSITDADITVNPRFGEFDPMLGLVPTQWPWMAQSDMLAVPALG